MPTLTSNLSGIYYFLNMEDKPGGTASAGGAGKKLSVITCDDVALCAVYNVLCLVDDSIVSLIRTINFYLIGRWHCGPIDRIDEEQYPHCRESR